MLQTSTVVLCAIDSLVPLRGKVQAGFEEFGVALDDAGIPAVWVTSRSRAQMDEPIRRFAHKHPFIAEDGCGAYLPEGYFHLRPPKTVRLGRFTCIPTAEPLPAASEALESLAEEAGVSVVRLRSLSPRELVQNSGLPARQAELSRQRDFDEPFFFAGASEQDVDRFVAAGRQRKLQLRQRGVLWSLAVGAGLAQCIRDLSKLYDRALRSHPTLLGISTAEESRELFAACDRRVLLKNRAAEDHEDAPSGRPESWKAREILLSAPDAWDQVLAAITSRS